MKRKDIDALRAILLEEIEATLDVVFALAGDNWTFAGLADDAGLATSTVYRAYHRDWARCPEFFTVQQLAYAVGLHVVADTDGQLSLSLIKTKRKAKRRPRAIAAAAA